MSAPRGTLGAMEKTLLALQSTDDGRFYLWDTNVLMEPNCVQPETHANFVKLSSYLHEKSRERSS